MHRSIQLLTLQCLLVIAEEGSLLGASQRLNMHHTTLSRRIRNLELTLDATLFDRHPSGVRPTLAGERFISNLRRVLTDLDGTLSMIEAGASGGNDRLSIGIDAPLPACGYLDAVAAFMRDRPDVGIRFIEAPRADLNAGINSRTIDVVIANGFGQRGRAECLPLWRDPIIVVMPAEHPFAGRGEIEWVELAREAMLANMQPIDISTIRVISADGSRSSIVRHDVSWLSLLNLVRKGLGVTLLPESNVANVNEGVVSSVLQNGGKPMYIRYDAHWRPNNGNPVLAAFIDFLKRKYPNPE
ncbi:LysR family transcriptional regulator [Mesorhizobium sp.]|uniref:LysR family transcriptional regulator n=1 Tax=Mesorhizobium sp. TaxID=1871066 RepID=UPI0011FCD2FD|nr:LysR family transcriptional regulator [Mesorhizobium sp.]TIS98033.1 MAG: LysR family transcriptional regulator [Mesorhizobium sp.]